MKLSLSLTRHERDTKQASKQASNEQQEPIDEGTKNSTSLPPSTNHSLTHTSLFLIFIIILESSSLGIGIAIAVGIGVVLEREVDTMIDENKRRCWIVSSYHRAVLLLGGGALARSIASHSDQHQRNEKISNNSSFGIIDIAHSSISDRIIVIVDTVRFIHDGAYR